MVNGDRHQSIRSTQREFIFKFFVSISDKLLDIVTFRISHYATASTDSATYIIGGYDGHSEVSTIAQFKNNEWRKIGELQEPKDPSAIFYNGEYLIVGGESANGR